MTVVDRPLRAPEQDESATPAEAQEELSSEDTISLVDDATDEVADPEPVRPRGPRELRFRGPKGMRISRIRLKSVMKIATVFFALGYLVTLGTLVVLWNVGLRLGFVDDVEELLVTSLGLESFDIVGQDLFDLAVVGFGVLFAMGLVITILLTVVYNATCALFGGLAVETGSLRRPRRVFSLRHRRFITIR